MDLHNHVSWPLYYALRLSGLTYKVVIWSHSIHVFNRLIISKLLYVPTDINFRGTPRVELRQKCRIFGIRYGP
jgi:hypothetical protein